MVQVFISTKTGRFTMEKSEKEKCKAKALTTIIMEILIMKVFGIKARSTAQGCISAMKRYIKAIGSMVNVQETHIMILNFRNRFILVNSYVDRGMAEEEQFTLMEVAIRENLKMIYRTEKEAFNMPTKITMLAILRRAKKKEKGLTNSDKEQFLKVFGKLIKKCKDTQYFTMEMSLQVLIKIIFVMKDYISIQTEISMRDSGKTTSNTATGNYLFEQENNMKVSLKRA